MFTTENVEVYLKSAILDTDGEKRIAKVKFHKTPIDYDLAREISPQVAGRLFHGSNGETNPAPVLEMTKAEFLLNIPKQSMSFIRDPGFSTKKSLVESAEIVSVSAQKLFADNPNFSLIFTVAFEITDKSILQDLVELLHEKVFITFRPMQGELFEGKPTDPVMLLLCRLCDAPNPEFVTTDGRFAYCFKHDKSIQEGETLRRIRDHGMLLRAVEEMQQGEEASKEKRTDPLDGDFNKRNQQSRRKAI